ncbi:hybrid sensor histidine kinase/response regulator [Entomomonas asaccharolytica]|uniref:Chemotaxis protein CheA n=1 Tax=Entomomonas asaccharolytica TaxID=2785331 RepID=A0A974NFS7_9GAMM|nr:Hpt domain-containing protein [Entomomonas asaccharolytica]QQP85784.1 Hpt domain-containing protein [Entomomonas asaccharolytica]
MAINNVTTKDSHDYVALSWVKNEIVNNLNQVQQVLESLADETTSKDNIASGLANCYSLLHQVSGALNMVGFPGAALFAEEIKTFCETLINDKVENFSHSLQVFMQAVLQMPTYLEIIQTEGHDIPIALLPLINEMRECYRATPLSEVELFSPKYYGAASPLTDEELKEINTEGLANLLRKLRQSLQLSLIDLIHNRNLEVALDHLIKIFNYLGRLCKATPISMLWRISLAFVTGINEKSIPNNHEAKDLLKQIDRQIKMLVEQGVVGMNNPAPDGLIKELLFLLAQVDSNSDEINAIKQEFHLTNLILNVKDVNTHQTKLANIDKAALESVSQALSEEFTFVKDRLDLFARSENHSEVDLQGLPETLKVISNTLEMLGLNTQKNVVNKQFDAINNAIINNYLDKVQAIDIAEAILDVETVVANITKTGGAVKTGVTGDAQEVVIREAAYELTQVKEILTQYFATAGKEGQIKDTTELLAHTAGALAIISQQRAAAVVIRCLQYIEEHLINSTLYPDNKEIDSIVGAIASIDYYMECLAKNQIVSAKDALNFAVKYLYELDYSLPDDYESLTTKYIASAPALEEAAQNVSVEDNVVDIETVEQPEVIAEQSPTIPEQPIVQETKVEDEIDEELVEIFTEEMEEILEALSTTLPAWVANTDDKDSLTEIRRSFHTIKGSGRMVKAMVIGELGWSVENMLNRVIDKTIPITQPILEVVQDVVKLLPELIKEFASGQQHPREDVDYYSAVADALAAKQVLPTKKKSEEVLTVEETVVEEDEEVTEPELVVEENLQAQEADPIAPSSDEEEASSASAEFDVELIDIFIAEAQTHMQTLKAFITLCERSLPQIVTDSLQRAMHTLKGSALMAGLDAIANIAKPFEGFLKECSINAWAIERIDLELLRDAYALLNKGIRQLELYSLAPVDGTESLVERIRLRREYLISQLEVTASSELANSDNDASPAALVSALMQSVDLLLDAEEYIEKWRETPANDFTQLSVLQEELAKVSPYAQQAGYPSIADLSNVLLKAYAAVAANTIKRDDAFFEALAQVHHVLLNCIDQLAAAQVVSEYPEEIASLEQILSRSNVQEEVVVEQDETIDQPIADKSEEVEKATEPEIIEADIEPTKQEVDTQPSTVEESTLANANTQVSTNFITEDKLILGAPAPAGPIIESEDDIDPDMAEIFLEEADEILVEARNDLDKWIEDQNPDHLKDLQRQLHTLKGGARMCGAVGLGDLAHGLEFIYEGLLNGRYSNSTDLVKLLNKTHDFIQLIVDTLHDSTVLPQSPELLQAIQLFRQEGRVVLDDVAIVSESSEPVVLEAEVVDNAAVIIQEPTEQVTEAQVVETEVIEAEEEDQVTSQPKEQPVTIDAEPVEVVQPTQVNEEPVVDQSEKDQASPVVVEFRQTEVSKPKDKVATKENKEVAEQIKVAAELLDSLVNLAGETSIYRSRVEQQNSDLASALMEMDATIDRVRDQLRRLDTETQAQIISRHQTEVSSSYTDFDPLEMDQYSQIQQLSRSLFESASDLQDLKDTLMRRNRDVETLLQQQGRVNTELQEGLMRTRMVPLDRIAPRLRRLVRQVSTELGKQVDLVIGNTAGEMDRGVIDAIVAPLEHMIRNSLDHGIESKEVREAAGKPTKGTISLDLIREGGEMVLRLKDDGAGISVQTVREKAINKGLMSPDEKLSDKEILQFILEAGFSTAKRITQISGRGVGLDVVVNAVKQLGGVLALDSEEGKGTTFSIRLPINLSVSRALMIRVGEDHYAIPMSTVEGVTYISPEQQKEFYQFGTAELEYGGESYRVKYLGELLGTQVVAQTQHVIEEKAPVLLVRSGEHYIALRVDELLPSSEVVVKSLGAQFLSVPAISGATILGDGHVIIILDLSALVRSYFVHQQHNVRTEERRVTTAEKLEEVKRPPLVMVVDDSVTVRKVTTRLLERQGMQVITARDGLDAVTQLEEKVPDIMLLDIEMPRMDGFEVATRVRNDERTKHLPIIMITSRSGEKHRERALAIGVNEYMSKPFMDAKLIKSISDLLPTFEVNLLESSS